MTTQNFLHSELSDEDYDSDNKDNIWKRVIARWPLYVVSKDVREGRGTVVLCANVLLIVCKVSNKSDEIHYWQDTVVKGVDGRELLQASPSWGNLSGGAVLKWEYRGLCLRFLMWQ